LYQSITHTFPSGPTSAIVGATTGAASIKNTLAQSFDIDYYEITSGSNSLREAGWTSIASSGASATGDYNQNGTVDASDYVVWRKNLGQNVALPNRDPANSGAISNADYNSWRSRFGNAAGQPWLEAGGSNDGTLSEGTLGSVALQSSQSISLGNIFKTLANGGTTGTQDLRFFVALTNGSVIRGTVTYTTSGLGTGEVPEPTAAVLFLTCALFGALMHHRSRALARSWS
jgi:hypothetical protein